MKQMTTNKPLTLFFAAITLTSFINVAAVEANPNGKQHKKHYNSYEHDEFEAPSSKRIMRKLSKLDLSDAQKTEIESLIADGIKSTKSQRETLKSMRHQMKALLQADNVDETAIRSLSTELANVKSELMILKLNKRQQIASLLNDEQKSKLGKMKSNRKSRRTY